MGLRQFTHAPELVPPKFCVLSTHAPPPPPVHAAAANRQPGGAPSRTVLPRAPSRAGCVGPLGQYTLHPP
jgi:hypothetical protein